MTIIDSRRRDSTRTNDNWLQLSETLNINNFKIKKNFKELETEFKIIHADELTEDQINFFVQFAIVPIKNEYSKGIIISDVYKRVPEFIIKDFSEHIFILNKQDCINLLNANFSKKSKSLIFTKETKSIEVVKSILSKMETIKASDLTLSWRRDNVYISYAISGKNIQEYQDVIDLELGDKLRISLINMAYENQAEKLIDGKFSLHILDDIKEYRLSVIETVAGYSIVIRSYQKFNSEMTLNDLGYMDRPKQIIKNIMERNTYGIFLVTGPTGSGKTTTIYTIINEAFKKRNLKIKTAEDPVEIEISGIDQCQINKKGEEKHWVTYVNLLYSFMRQRPDIMVIGEIRDKEVAMSTIEAALTGHIVISTLHTNNINATFTRLINNLGITTDRIEDSVSGVLSQRLVDKLCECKLTDGEGYKANEDGCPKCKGNQVLGFNGQIPAVEVASLKKEEKNYLKENFLEYYSYSDSAKDLYENGLIDKKTKNMLEML